MELLIAVIIHICKHSDADVKAKISAICQLQKGNGAANCGDNSHLQA
jgi:hypothetical protein